MANGALVYKVDDRSILLPYYRRYLVDPLLPLIPARVNPNSITHTGHLLNLAGTALLVGLWPERGPVFVVAMLLLQIYMWCDNADGSHARRTNQCSAFGEFLDHGLDQLNTVYIAYLTCMALGVSPLWWVIIAFIIPAAGAVTYWEQSQTGVFRLGLLNQVESLSVLSIVLTISAVLGSAFWSTTKVFGISLQHAMLAWSSITITFGMIRSIGRVAAARGALAALPILGFLAFAVAVVAATFFGVIAPITGVVLCTGLNVFTGMRMLAHRLHEEEPRAEAPLFLGAAVLALLAGLRFAGMTLSPTVGLGFALFAGAAFVILAIGDTRRSIVRLAAR